MKSAHDRLKKVTILTACKNSADTIEQTILSVINQTYPNIEYIIIDGASTDGTLEIIKRYENDIANWISEPDKGLYDAYNKGLHMATGDVIGIIDSNDWYAQNAVDNAMLYLTGNNVQFVYGDLVLVKNDGHQEYQRGADSLSQGVAQWYGYPTLFIKKEIYDRYGYFDLAYRILADFDFMLKLRRNNVPCCYVPHIMAYYRLDGISSSPHSTYTRLKESRQIFSNMLHHYIKDHVNHTKIQEVQYNFEKHLLTQYIKYRLFKYNFLKNCVHQLLIDNKKRALVIWGVGDDLRLVLPTLTELNILPRIFVDGSKSRQGEIIAERLVLSPDNIQSDDFIIVTSRRYYEEISRQLMTQGKKESIEFCSYDELEHEVIRNYFKLLC